MLRPILLVEDNPMDIDLTQRAFNRRKLLNKINVVRDGAEALDLIAHWQPGDSLPLVILLDLKLPKVDGLEVLRQLKQHPQLKVVPVVMLTSSAEDSDIQTAYQYGVNSYIVKPVDFEKFLEIAAHIDLYWAVVNVPPTD